MLAPVDVPANAGIRREPELPKHEEIALEQAKPAPEFLFSEEDRDNAAFAPAYCASRPAVSRARPRWIPATSRALRPIRTKHTFRLLSDPAAQLADYAGRKHMRGRQCARAR
jgi:hypothetical protein